MKEKPEVYCVYCKRNRKDRNAYICDSWLEANDLVEQKFREGYKVWVNGVKVNPVFFEAIKAIPFI